MPSCRAASWSDQPNWLRHATSSARRHWHGSFILSVIVPALAARDRHRLRRPAISSIIEPCRPWLSWVGKGSSVFSEREALLKCTERFGPNPFPKTSLNGRRGQRNWPITGIASHRGNDKAANAPPPPQTG